MSVYLDAIEVLEERGWHQGDYEGDDGSVCVLGAINVALCGTASTADCFGDVFHPLLARVPAGYGGPTAYNDDPSTSYEDIVLLLKRAHEQFGGDE